MTRPRTKTIPGYRVQPAMPLGFPCFGASILDAAFTRYDDLGECVEVEMRIGLVTNPYTVLLTIEQALAADIIERD